MYNRSQNYFILVLKLPKYAFQITLEFNLVHLSNIHSTDPWGLQHKW